MTKYLVPLIMLTLSEIVWAQPIGDIDELQIRIEKCIKGAAPDGCLNKLLAPHLPPGHEELSKTIPKITSGLANWLAGDTVYAVHPIKKTKAGNLYERRVYVIEDEKGNFMVFDSSYIRIRGNLYMKALNLSNKREVIDALFKDQ